MSYKFINVLNVLFPQPTPKGCTIHKFGNIVFYDEKGFGDSVSVIFKISSNM